MTVINESNFDVASENGHVVVSVTLNPDGTAMVSYTRRNGANGICEATVEN